MSQQLALRALDAAIMEAFDTAGFSDDAVYTQVSGSPVACSVYVDRGVTLDGLETEVRSDAVTITAYRSEVGEALPRKSATFVIGSETFKVDQILNADESRVVCLVTT